MKEQERLWILFARQLAGEATEEELLELQQLLKQYPDVTHSPQILSQLLKPGGHNNPEENEEAFTRHHQRMALREATKEANYFAHHVEQGRTARQVRWKNNLRTAVRSLLRNKSFSLINISGLAIGMASALIILLWVQLQLSYDQFHQNKDRVYELYNRMVLAGRTECWGGTPMVMTSVLKKDYPQVEEVARLNWVGAFTLGDQHLQTQGYITDPGFFRIFSFPLVQGNPNTALNAPHSIVLTERTARKLFGNTQVLGKVIRVDSNANFTITGVLKDLPINTQFKSLEYLIPWSYMKEVGWETGNWEGNTISTYVLLRQGVSEQAANDRLRTILQLHSKGSKNEIFLHPMRKWWLYSNFENGMISGGRIHIVHLFSIIAGFILLIACINYMNLSTARSQRRAKEVGIRKVIGAGKLPLIRQFMGESILISFLAGLLALLIVQPGLRGFNWLAGQDIDIPYAHIYFWLTVIGFILLTGVIAGSYPAFYLSSFRPIHVLKGIGKAGNALVTPRKILVVFQFTFAIILIICTVIIYRQLRYSQERDLGYNKDQLAFVYIKGDISKNYPLIKKELLNSGAVISLTRTNSPIMDIWTRDSHYEWAGKDSKVQYGFAKFQTDRDFTRTMGLTVLTGRDINVDLYPADSAAVVLNANAVKLMGFDDPLGQTIRNDDGNWRVVGVVKDFVPGDAHEPIQPVVIHGVKNTGFGVLSMRMNEKSEEYLKKIRDIFKKYNPDYPFDYKLVTDAQGEQFQDTQHIGILAASFAGLTIFISCLGLFALAAYMAENRIKEIGVRKVLGASVSGITALLSKDFMKLVLIAFLIASPLAAWAMYAWLQEFPYHIHISWWIFALAGLLTGLIALVTVSSQAIRAALTNPVKSLRTE